MYSDTQIVFPNLGGLSLDPPRGFNIGDLTIYFYGIIIALGLVLAVLYGMKRSRQFGIQQDDLLDGVLWIVPVAIISARLYYVFSAWEQYADEPINILNIRQGGLAIYGGVIGAVIGVIVFCKIKKISLPAVLDLVALGFLIGQAIGRWGNFMNREAFGCYTDGLFAMRISEDCLGNVTMTDTVRAQIQQLKDMAVAGGYQGMIQVHPTFLYESVWNTLGFVALHFLSKKRQYDGQIALGYVAWYGMGRAIIEGLRMDSLYWGPFRASQLLAAVTCLIAVATLLILNLRSHKPLFVDRVNAELEDAPEEAEESGETEETETSDESEESAEESDEPEESAEESEEPGETGETEASAPEEGEEAE